MVSTKRKNLAAVVGMALLHIYFLMTHFSTMGCVVTLLSIIYQIVSSYILAKDSQNIIAYIGELFGVTICDFILVSLFNMGASFAMISLDVFSKTPGVLSVLGIGFLFFVLKKIHTDSLSGKRLIAFISKYLIIGVMAYIINRLIIGWDNQRLIYLLVVYLLINAFFEQVITTYSSIKKAAAMFYWCYVNIVICICGALLFPDIMQAILSKVSTLSMLKFRWYGVIITILIFLSVGTYTWIVDSNEKVYPNDSKLCLAFAIACGMIPFILSVYTRYCVLAFIILGILYFVLFFGVTNNSRYIKVAGKSFLKLDVVFIVGVLVLAVCQYAFIHGELFAALLMCFAMLLGILLYRFQSGKNGLLFWEYIVIAFFAYMCERVNHMFNYRNSYILLVFILAISTIALLIADVKNKNKFSGNVAMKLTVVICSCVVMFSAVTNYGIKYDLKIDDKIAQSDPMLADSVGESKAIHITLKARGKDNKVVKCYYYWNNDVDARQEVSLDDNNQFIIEPNNGELHIYAEDQFGVSSYKKQWFYN